MMRHNFLSVLLLTVSVLAASDFADTCTILSLSQGSGGGSTGRASASTTVILNARCEDSAGVLHGTTIDLNRCFGNINGQITCGSTNLGDTCTGCHIAGSEQVQCTCKTSSGGTRVSTTSMNICIGNQNGALVC